MGSDEFLANLDTIYNALNQIRRKRLNGRSPIQALMHEIQTLGFYHAMDVINNSINCLFIAFKNSLKLAKGFNTLLIMDCTYKTNKYNMPMLHILGVDNCNNSFKKELSEP